MFKIRRRREIAPNVHELVIEAAEVARRARPGQFVILMVDERSERIPYTLSDWDREAGTITMVVQEVGLSSRKLILVPEGGELAHVVGPLGIPLEIARFGHVVLAAGCYGIGAILRLGRELRAAANKVTAIVEARSSYLHYYTEQLTGAVDELVQTTIDGSEGQKGHSVDVLQRMLDAGQKPDRVIVVGCPFVMMLASQITKPFEIKTLVALNPIMLDGTGMCGACRVTVGNKMLFACVDGPFFDGHQVDWDELWDRKAAYSHDEIQAVARTDAVERGHTQGGRCH